MSQIPKTCDDSPLNFDSHPDAHANRLALALMCLSCGEEISSNKWKTDFWNVESDYKEYLNKYAHVSMQCRLTDRDERLLLSIFPKSKRSRYLDAVREVRNVGSEGCIEISNPGVPATFLTHQPLSNSIDVNSPIFSQLAAITYFYRRPDLTSIDTVCDSMKALWRCFEHRRSLQGKLSYLGFLFLYELLVGVIVLRLDNSTEQDDLYMDPTDVAKETAESEGVQGDDVCLAMAQGLLGVGIFGDTWKVEEIAALIELNQKNIDAATNDFFENPEDAKRRYYMA